MQVAAAVAVAVAVAAAVAAAASGDDEDGVQLWWEGGVQWWGQRSTAMAVGATDRQ